MCPFSSCIEGVRVSIGQHGPEWASMGPHGSEWVSMGQRGSAWVSVGPHSVSMGQQMHLTRVRPTEGELVWCHTWCHTEASNHTPILPVPVGGMAAMWLCSGGLT